MSVRATQGGYTLRIDANASGYAFSGFQRLPSHADPTYVVWVSGIYCQTMNTNTGIIEYSGVNQTSGFGQAFNNLTSGRVRKETVKAKGDFTVTSLKLPSYSLFDCTEARIFQSGGTNSNMIANIDQSGGNTDIEIVGGTFDGNLSGQGGGGTENSQSMVAFMRCSGIWIHDGLYKHGDFHNLRFWECPWDVKVTNITSIDSRHEHISDHAQSGIVGGYRSHVFADNVIRNVNAGDSHITVINVSDVVITGNTCEKTFNTSSIAVDGRRAIISNNTIRNADTVAIILGQLSGIHRTATGTIISNNIITATSEQAIVSNGQPTDDFIVANNSIDNSGSSGGNCIAIANSKNLVVTGNIVRNGWNNGIQIYGGGVSGIQWVSRDVIVSNNICYNNGRNSGAADTQNAGIQVRSLGVVGDVSRISVYNNRCYDTSTSGGQKWGLRIATTANCIAKGNDLRNNVISGFAQTGNTGLIMNGNPGVDE